MIESIQPNDNLPSASKVWQAFLAGDRKAFEHLFRRFYDDLYHYAVKFCGDRETAEDHIQKLFLTMWRKRAQLGDVEGVKTYLWTALRRSMIDTIRKRKTEQKYIDKFAHNKRMQFTAEELIVRDEMDTMQSRELERAMDQLTPKEREVLYLKFYEGMSYEEIEQIMSVSYQTSRNYVYRALQSLKMILSSEITFGGFTVGFCIIYYLFSI